MQELIDRVQAKSMKKIVDIRPGYTVRVHQKIREGDKERVQMFEGVVIKVSSGRNVDKTFTVRKVVQGIGVEKIFPMHSKNVVQIEIKKQSKVRRAKLYYTRERFGKKARMKGDIVDIKAIEEEATPAAEAGEVPETMETAEATPGATVAEEASAAETTGAAEEEAPEAEETHGGGEPEAKAEIIDEPKTEVKGEAEGEAPDAEK